MKNARRHQAALASALIFLAGSIALAGDFGGTNLYPVTGHEGIDNMSQLVRPEAARQIALQPVEICTVPHLWDVEDYAPGGVDNPAPWLPFRAGLFMLGQLSVGSVPSWRGVIMNIGLPTQCPSY